MGFIVVSVGDVFNSNSCGKFTVISVESFKRVKVVFNNTGYECYARCDSVEKGTIKDKLHPSVHGVGFVGVGEFKTSSKGKNNKAYLTWQRMLGRCYDSNNASSSYYKDCSVDPEWHNFQNFAKWFYDNYPDTNQEIHLDKDIKIKGNKVYSKETCKLVTLSENVSHAKAKHFKLISPNGEITSVYNLEKFCRERGLNKANMHKVATGKNKSCKGWATYHE